MWISLISAWTWSKYVNVFEHLLLGFQGMLKKRIKKIKKNIGVGFFFVEHDFQCGKYAIKSY